MIEISINNIKKSYGFKNILDGFSLEIKTGDKVSLIGENGCGKTTILNIINKKENIDSGVIAIRNGATIGYLNQQPEDIYINKTVKEILYENLKDILELEKLLKKYVEKMNNNSNDMNLITKYLNVQEKYMNIGGYEVNTLIEKVSHGLNISHLIDKGFSTLSGGEQKRVVLASIIIKKPTILLLDEPTNHLDIETLEWLEDYLNKYNGTLLLVSHDRYFLDKVTNKTVLIENGKEKTYKVILNVEDMEDKNYVIYKDEENKEEVCYASEYIEKDGSFNIKPIKDEKVYKLLEEILSSIDNIEE